MNVMARYSNRRTLTIVSVSAVFLSILLSLWSGLTTPVINRDGICYLESASAMGMTGIQQAIHLCAQAKWPFYSFLVYSVTALTSLTGLAAANVLDGLFSIITVVTFIYLVRLLGGSPRTMGYAAAVILLAHSFNSVREFIIRDHGFWAFYLISVAALIHFFRKRLFRYAILWWGSMVLATLFRIEGAVFLLGLPCLAFFVKERRLLALSQLYFFTVTIGCLFIAWLLHKHYELTRLIELKLQLVNGLSLIKQQFLTEKAALAHYVLNQYASHDAGVLLVLFTFTWYVQNVVANLSIVYAGLIIYAWRQKIVRLDRPAFGVLLAYIILNVVITLAFLGEHLFLSKRYLIALSLILMLWVPFALEYLFERVVISRWVKVGLSGLILIYALGGIVHVEPSKGYIIEAGKWIENNIPANANVYSNDEQLMYYSHHYGNSLFIKSREYANINVLAQEKWKQYDYLAIRLAKQDMNRGFVIREITATPIQVFANRHGDQVLIYPVKK